jgi:vacuolar iron transporter family protein
LAQDVAEQLHAVDPVAAQLQIEYGIDEIPGPSAPVTDGLGTAGAFALGASIPLIITTLAPFQLDTFALLIAVTASLTLTSILTARSAHLSAPRTIVRTLAVGLGTMAVSYLAGLALLPPAD